MPHFLKARVKSTCLGMANRLIIAKLIFTIQSNHFAAPNYLNNLFALRWTELTANCPTPVCNVNYDSIFRERSNALPVAVKIGDRSEDLRCFFLVILAGAGDKEQFSARMNSTKAAAAVTAVGNKQKNVTNVPTKLAQGK